MAGRVNPNSEFSGLEETGRERARKDGEEFSPPASAASGSLNDSKYEKLWSVYGSFLIAFSTRLDGREKDWS